MTWNGSVILTIKGVCEICKQEFERTIAIHSVRQMKNVHCGGYNCKRELANRKRRELTEKVRARA